MRIALLMLGLIAGLCLSNPAQAGIYKCIDTDGGISYSQQECPLEQTTANVLSKKGRVPELTDCSAVDEFIRQTATDLVRGTSREEVVEEYGGAEVITRPVRSLINYIYSFSNEANINVNNIDATTTKRCEAGKFGTITCSMLPILFANQASACISNGVPSSRYASNPFEDEIDRVNSMEQ